MLGPHITPDDLDIGAREAFGDIDPSTPLPENLVINRHTGERIEFLTRARDSGGTEMSMRFVAAPGGGVPFFHLHRFQEEWFRCLEGELVVQHPAGETVLKAGDEMSLPPATMHALINRSDRDAVLEAGYRPAGKSEMWLRMVHAWHDRTGREPGLLDIAPFIGEVGIDIKGPPVWAQRLLFAFLKPISILLGRRRRMLANVSAVYGREYSW